MEITLNGGLTRAAIRAQFGSYSLSRHSIPIERNGQWHSESAAKLCLGESK
jgi:hypothetical protein